MTRESTAPLKGWMNEHKKNPYPTKGERIMLAIISRLTMTQVSTYQRRRKVEKCGGWGGGVTTKYSQNIWDNFGGTS